MYQKPVQHTPALPRVAAVNSAAMQFNDAITLIKQQMLRLDQSIDRLAQHPVLDKIENIAGQLGTRSKHGARWLANVARPLTHNEKLHQYARLVRLDKPIGILLLLWPTLIALWIAAGGWPDTRVLVVFVLGVILMRSAGCAINDYADRDIDKQVKRTRDRPLTSGKISATETLLVFAVLSLCAFGLVLLMNTLTIWMSLAGIALAVSYPFMKRYHYLPQVHLGAAFGWAVPMAFTAQANEITPLTWLLFLATVLWATAYDTLYAMVDRDDDIRIGVKSTAILFGPADRLIIGIIQLMLLLALLMIGERAELSGFYYAGVSAATVFALWQHYLIRNRERDQCFRAFLNNNWLGFALFMGVFCDYQFGDLI